MARIRSIKPEFPHSQSMGNVSRECRLFFILLWTLADDAGKLRGNSRLLASLLYPYDKDIDNVDKWLEELVREKCITCYTADNNDYIKILNWQHQRIDKPSKSKIPDPPDDLSSDNIDSRNSREDSREYDESSTGDRRIVGSEDRGSGKGSGSDDDVRPRKDFQKVFQEGITLFPDLTPKNNSEIHMWIRAGYDIELDILPELRRGKAYSPKAWNYFTDMIAKAHAARTAAPPDVKSLPTAKMPTAGSYRDKVTASNLEVNEQLARKYAEN